MDLFNSYRALAAPGIGDGAGNVDHTLIFSSGMSRRPDFTPALRADHSIGIDIGEMSQAAMDDLAAELAPSAAHVFVDSGAFAAFRSGLRGKPSRVDFAKVFDRYERLALAVSKADPDCTAPHRVHYVMPDVVGDQAATLDALREYSEAVRDYHDGFNAIIPVQAGSMSLVEFFDAIVAIVGRDDLTIGVPSAEAAISNRELMDLLAARPSIYGVHILGAASEKRAGPRLAVLREVGFDGTVTLDANRLRGYWNAYTPRPEARARLLAGLPPKRAPRRVYNPDGSYFTATDERMAA